MKYNYAYKANIARLLVLQQEKFLNHKRIYYIAFIDTF